MPVEKTPPPAIKRIYPHVDGITDWQTQQTIRLLWDRVFDLEARLQAADATNDTLVAHANDSDAQLRIARRDALEALALAQQTAAEIKAGELPLPGEATIPDYFDIVAETLAGFNPVIPVADRDAGKAQLTRAAAWAIYQVDPNIGLLAKDYGSNVNGRSTDIIVQMTDGSYADCCSDPETPGDPTTVTITATWNAHPGDSNTTDEGRWIVPTSAIAGESGPMEPA